MCVLLNVLLARHYKRWDWTSGKLYTLSGPTLETLHSLPDKVQLWVILGGGDPMEQSLRHLLSSYEGETQKLDVHWVDPDKDVLALQDLRKRFKVETSPAQDGRMVADAIVIVARGDRHWFLTPADMVEVTPGDDTKARPREEQAITGAIRRVVAGERTKLCFLTGHGERSIEDGSDEGLGLLRDVLEKDNYDTEAVDSTPPNAFEPFKGCDVVIVAAPSVRGARSLGPLTDAEATRLRTYLMSGGNMLLTLGAESDDAAGPLGKVLAPFGIGLGDRLVLEPDPKLLIPDSRANTFIATARTHPVTTGLVPTDELRDPPRVVVDTSRPLHHVVDPSGTTASDLLVSSDKSFAVGVDRAGAIARTPPSEVPEKARGDEAGPFVLAMASERPKVSRDAAHGPRVVVFGSSSALAMANWRAPLPWRGTAFLVENAVAWLAAKPEVLDIPDKPTVGAGLKMNAAVEGQVQRYVLLYMPLAAFAIALGVGLRRRSTEGKPRNAPGKAGDRRPPKKRKAKEAPDEEQEDGDGEDEREDAPDDDEDEDTP